MSKLITLPDGSTREDLRNGTSQKLLWWMLGIFATLTLMGGSFWLTTVNASVDQLKSNDIKREGQIATLTAQVTELIRQTGRMEGKLDRVLERR